LLNMYRSGQVDGVILMEIYMQDWRVNLLRQNDYPFVAIGRCADNSGLNFVDVDLEEGVVQAIDHLVELGHQDIAFLGLSPEMHQQGYGPAARHKAGYNRARQKHNLDVAYLEVDLSISALFEATLKLLAERPQLTAIVATQGALTIGVLRALRQAGRAVPDDFSVVGITTRLIAELITPPLTTLNIPSRTEGFQAARMLISRLNQEPLDNTQILLPPELIVRSSTGPVNP